MGYAQSIPFALYNVGNNGSWSYLVTLTTIAGTKALGDLTTPDYKLPLTSAYAEIIVQSIKNTNAAENYFDNTNLGHLNLNDGVTDYNSGNIPNREWYVPASSWVHGDFKVRLAEELVTYIKPNTTYTMTLHNAQAKQNDLLLYNPRVELTLLFGT